jgi:hypothetical protein
LGRVYADDAREPGRSVCTRLWYGQFDSEQLSSGPPAGRRGQSGWWLKKDFAIAKEVVATAAVAQGATDGGALAVAEAYHGTLVAPFCFAAVKSFFANP